MVGLYCKSRVKEMEKPVEGRSIRDTALMGRIQFSLILKGKTGFALWTFLENTDCFLGEHGAWKCFATDFFLIFFLVFLILKISQRNLEKKYKYLINIK